MPGINTFQASQFPDGHKHAPGSQQDPTSGKTLLDVNPTNTTDTLPSHPRPPTARDSVRASLRSIPPDGPGRAKATDPTRCPLALRKINATNTHSSIVAIREQATRVRNFGVGKSFVIAWNNTTAGRHDRMAIEYMGNGLFASIDRLGNSLNIGNDDGITRTYRSGGSTITFRLYNPTGSGWSSNDMTYTMDLKNP